MTNSSREDFVLWRDMIVRVTEQVGERTVAKWLCEHASGCDSEEFADILDELVSQRAGEHVRAMVERLSNGEPLQYVMGRWSFRHLDLLIDERVLIPRPETELLVDIAKKHLESVQRPMTIVDLGTGSGAIGLSLLFELPLESATVHMTDASEDALHVARANAAGIGRPSTGARFGHGSWYEALPIELRGTVHAIVSNPPYIAEGDPEVGESVLQWEPHHALFAGADGLNDVRTIINEAHEWLAPNGLLVIEMGYTQGAAVTEIFTSAGFLNITIHKDLAGLDRFVSGVSR
jgi:release factor glutamine methyltransferase